MSQLNGIELSLMQRKRRSFSEGFKRAKVGEIEAGLSRIFEISKQYQVSKVSIYRWINKYGSNLEPKERLIMEHKSDTQQLLAMKKKIAELERIIGQKQLLIDFKDKMIELAEEHYGIEIKKNSFIPPSTGSGNQELKD
jgi:transposase-like protein